MAERSLERATTEELLARLAELGPTEKGEIVDGVLFVQPRPRPRHSWINGLLSRHIGGGVDFDAHAQGPEGWWIVLEPGIKLPDAPEISPDLAGWRRERTPVLAEDESVRPVPDWVCEVLSPSNARWDRLKKFPLYARVGVEWLWAVDPGERIIEVRQLVDGQWMVVATLGDEERVCMPPFEEIEIPLSALWLANS